MADFFRKIKKVFHDPLYVYYKAKFVLGRRYPKVFSDKFFLEGVYYLTFNKRLNLKNPQTFNEKLQWLKLYNRRPEYTTMVDKYAAKEYVAGIIGEEHIIPTLGVWDSFDEIDFDALPDQFVLKTTHDSGSVVVCRDKSRLDKDKAREILTKSLDNDFYLQGREWPYKNVPRRIIAEEFMVDESGFELKDYKYYCFDGKAKFMYIVSGRQTHDKVFHYYDMDFNKIPMEWAAPVSDKIDKQPPTFYKMKELAEKLAQGQPHVRIDFYDVNGSIYFGEITFFGNNGFAHFKPEEWDKKIGDWLKLPPKFVGNNR